MGCQRDGTAVPSLASEYLQEADLLSGLERQQTVQTIKDVLGSMFEGKSWRSLHTVYLKRLRRASAGSQSVRISLFPWHCFLTEA